jgi:hypothetical protein
VAPPPSSSLFSSPSPLSSLAQATSPTLPSHRRLCSAPHLDDFDQRLTAVSVQCLTSTALTDASSSPLYSASCHHDDLDRCFTDTSIQHLTTRLPPHLVTDAPPSHLNDRSVFFFSSIFFFLFIFLSFEMLLKQL